MDAPVEGPRGGSTRLAAILLLGTVLLGIGAALHPILPMDLAGQLAVIAHTSYWRAIHITMLVGSALVMIGIWGQLPTHNAQMRLVLALIFAIIVCGLALNASNILFMARTGTGDAARYIQGHEDAAAGFAQGHIGSLLWARAGNGIVALACIGLAIVLHKDRRQPLYVVVLAAAAAIGGIVGVTAFDPASRGAVTAVALFSVWAGVAALRSLWVRSESFRAGDAAVARTR